MQQDLSINSRNSLNTVSRHLQKEEPSKLEPSFQMSVLDTISRKKYIFISIFPTYLCVILGVAYPNLIGREVRNFRSLWVVRNADL